MKNNTKPQRTSNLSKIAALLDVEVKTKRKDLPENINGGLETEIVTTTIKRYSRLPKDSNTNMI